MTTHHATIDLYNRFLVASAEAMDGPGSEVAYHALAAALH